MAAVSVIMPAWNAAPYIGAAIDSLRAQTVADWELIVADDGSTDSTADIVAAASAADPRIRLLRLAARTGSPMRARSAAAALASAPMIFPFDADDLLEPRFLERMLGRAADTGADMVLCSLHTFTDSPSEATLYLPGPEVDTTAVRTGAETMPLTLGRWQVAGNGLFDAALFRAAGADAAAYADNPFADELLFRTMLTRAAHVAIEPARYLYRMSGGSLSHDGTSLRRFAYLDTNLALRRIASDICPDGVELHIYHGLATTLELLGRRAITDATRAEVTAMLRRTYDTLDFDRLARHIGGPRFSIIRLGLGPARLILSLYGRLRRPRH